MFHFQSPLCPQDKLMSSQAIHTPLRACLGRHGRWHEGKVGDQLCLQAGWEASGLESDQPP